MPKTDDKPKTIRFLVGANVGSERYEVGDTAPDHVLSPATRKAWMDDGYIEWAD